jgi:hypothetical protein
MKLIAYAIFLHFIADFLLQSREMGKNKSHDLFYLLMHVMIQWLVMFGGLLFMLNPVAAYQIAAINAFIHGLIDWNIWRYYKRWVKFRFGNPKEQEFKYWEDSGFYSTIGFDQMLHMWSILFAIWFVL